MVWVMSDLVGNVLNHQHNNQGIQRSVLVECCELFVSDNLKHVKMVKFDSLCLCQG